MEKLKLSDVRPKLSFSKNTGLSIFSIRDIIKYPEDYIIDFDVFLPTKNKNLQRDFVWNLHQKQELILSILKGINIPPMSIVQKQQGGGNNYFNRKDRKYEIIDGKQRLSSIISFVKGEFPIIVNEVSYFIDDLDEQTSREIKNYWVKADVAYSYEYEKAEKGDEDAFITDDQKIAWFEMINFSGTPQDIEHLNNLKK